MELSAHARSLGTPASHDHSSTPAAPRDPYQLVSTADQTLATVLIQSGLISMDQLHAAQLYSVENHRDLRQAILELNLISAERLNALAFERLTALAGGNGGGVSVERGRVQAPLAPRSGEAPARHPQRAEGSSPPPPPSPTWSAQILERACESRATDIHFDPQERGLRVRYRIDGQLQDVLELDTAIGHRR